MDFILLSALRVLRGLAFAGLPVIFMCSILNTLASAADFSTEIADQASIVNVSGMIDSDDGRWFLNIARGLPRDRPILVKLHGPGGLAMGGIYLGLAFRQAGAITFVADGSICVSSCAFAWLGGAKRSLAANGHVGFHAPYEKESHETNNQSKMIVQSYVNALGLSPSFVDYIMSRKVGEGFAWLDAAGAARFGIDINLVEASPGSDGLTSTLLLDLGNRVSEAYRNGGAASGEALLSQCLRSFQQEPSVSRGMLCFSTDALVFYEASEEQKKHGVPIPPLFDKKARTDRFMVILQTLGYPRQQWQQVADAWAGLFDRTFGQIAVTEPLD